MRSRVVPVVLASLLLTGLLAALLPVWPVLRVSHGEEVVADLRLPEGRFTLGYVHSIDRLPVEEDLQVSQGRLVVQTTRVRQFGAGMGQIAGEGRGYADPPWWVVTDMGRDIGTEVHLRVGAPGVDHRLQVPGTEGEAHAIQIQLTRCWAGERLSITPATVSTWRLLTGPTGAEQIPCAGTAESKE